MDHAHFELVKFCYVYHAPHGPKCGQVASNVDQHLVHVTQGEATLIVADRKLKINAQNVLYVPPHVRFQYIDKIDDQPLEMLNYHFHAGDAELPIHFLVSLPYLFRPPNIARIHKDLRNWHTHWIGGDRADQLMVSAKLHAMLADYVRQFAQPNTTPRADMHMARLRHQLEQRGDQPFRASDWAASCNLSVSQMNRRFRRIYSETPHAHWKRIRLAFLRRRLMTTDQTIDQIADEMGFADRYHLTRWFTRLAGMSPAAYRRQMSRLQW